MCWSCMIVLSATWSRRGSGESGLMSQWLATWQLHLMHHLSFGSRRWSENMKKAGCGHCCAISSMAISLLISTNPPPPLPLTTPTS